MRFRGRPVPDAIPSRRSAPGAGSGENGGMAVKYDRIGDTYDLTRRPDPRIADRLMVLLGAAPGASVLDVACGTGNYTSALSARGLAMVGLDVSRTMLVRARTKHPLLPLVRGDGAALPFADGAFSHAVTTPGHSPHGGPARDLLEHPPRGGPGRPLPHLLRASRTTGDVLADELPPGDDGIGGARIPRREGGLRQ